MVVAWQAQIIFQHDPSPDCEVQIRSLVAAKAKAFSWMTI